jgi:hypothetical protein
MGLVASFALLVAAATPSLADISDCTKLPNADTCPTMGPPTKANAAQQASPKHLRHTHYRYEPAPKQNKG